VASCWAVPLTKHRDWLPVRRAYKFRAYLTRPQDGRAVRLLADHCDLYNAALMERREAWQMRRVNINYGSQSAQLKDMRRAGRRVVLVNPARTSVSCHRCGSRCARPQQRVVICPLHGVIDADVNGARNIASRAGLGSGQATPAA
jgi:hypothetical protein